jgi:hypothetical protein
LTKKEVLTVIGTGEKGFDREGNKNPEHQKLSSPWDIAAINKDTLIIAMAGVHQLWALNLKTVRIVLLIFCINRTDVSISVAQAKKAISTTRMTSNSVNGLSLRVFH